MKSMEEFYSVVEERMKELEKKHQQEVEEQLTAETQKSEIFADSIIQLLCLEIKDFDRYGKKEISHRFPIMKSSDYIIDEDKRNMSYIEADQFGVTLNLKYPYEKKYNPFQGELNQDITNEILRPYFVSVRYEQGGEYDCGQLIVFYDHIAKIKSSLQIPSEEKDNLTL